MTAKTDPTKPAFGRNAMIKMNLERSNKKKLKEQITAQLMTGHGLPDSITLDNGRANHSKVLHGVLAELNIKVNFLVPGKPSAKRTEFAFKNIPLA